MVLYFLFISNFLAELQLYLFTANIIVFLLMFVHLHQCCCYAKSALSFCLYFGGIGDNFVGLDLLCCEAIIMFFLHAYSFFLWFFYMWVNDVMTNLRYLSVNPSRNWRQLCSLRPPPRNNNLFSYNIELLFFIHLYHFVSVQSCELLVHHYFTLGQWCDNKSALSFFKSLKIKELKKVCVHWDLLHSTMLITIIVHPQVISSCFSLFPQSLIK